MKNLITLNNNVPVTTTQKIAYSLKMKHAEVIRRLEELFVDFPELRVVSNHPKMNEDEEVFIPYEAIYRGQIFTAYLMNEPAFTLLLPRFKVKRAKQAYREFNRSFYQMRKTIIQLKLNRFSPTWNSVRKECKTNLKDFTKVVAEFASYSEKQGSNADIAMLMIHFNNWHYKSLKIGKLPKGKTLDSLPPEQLEQLEALREQTAEILTIGMDNELYYKDIKKDVKQLLQSHIEEG